MRGDGTGGRGVDDVVDIEPRLDDVLHQRLDVRYADFREAVVLQHMREARQHARALMRIVVLEIVRAEDRVELRRWQHRKLACIRDDVGIAARVDIERTCSQPRNGAGSITLLLLPTLRTRMASAMRVSDLVR